jgi:hypothetical protein
MGKKDASKKKYSRGISAHIIKIEIYKKKDKTKTIKQTIRS